MLNEEELQSVKEKFINCVMKIGEMPKEEEEVNYTQEQEEEVVDEFKQKLQNLCDVLDDMGFFISPASTQYNCAFQGGLALHSLNVCFELYRQVQAHKDILGDKISKDDIIIVGLFHDLYKMNLYETYYKNEKEYREDGNKFDNIGKYEWVSIQKYKIRDLEDRDVCGENGFRTYMFLKNYIDLTDEQIIALVNYNGMNEDGISNKNFLSVLSKHPLTALLYISDIICTYIEERQSTNE